jgi:hypothetical protein
MFDKGWPSFPFLLHLFLFLIFLQVNLPCIPFTLNLPFLSSQGVAPPSPPSPQNDASLSLNSLQTIDLIQSARELVREYTPGDFLNPQPIPNDTVP